jgi:cellobiose-specific phosphotransferase system component IIC
MKKILKTLANILTGLTTLLMVIGLGYNLMSNLPLSDLFAEVSFCYVAIAAFNFLMLGEATLWHKRTDL